MTAASEDSEEQTPEAGVVAFTPEADGSAVDSSVADGSAVDSSVADGSAVDSSVADGSVADGAFVDEAAAEEKPEREVTDLLNRARGCRR